MKRYLRVVLSMSLLAAVLSLASCGGNGLAGQEESVSSDARRPPTGWPVWTTAQLDSGEIAPKESIVDGEYSDERFIGIWRPITR